MWEIRERDDDEANLLTFGGVNVIFIYPQAPCYTKNMKQNEAK